VRDPHEALGRLEAPIEGMHLHDEAVQPLENRVELSIVEILSFRHRD
jgi:hypothetical protein